MKLLLVDDDVDLAEMMSRRLVRKGHVVFVAHSVDEAEECFLAQGEGFEGVICDLNLGVMRGTDVYHRLQIHGFTGVFVIMTGDSVVDSNLTELMKSGKVWKLEKPFDMNVLTTLLKSQP